MRDLKEWVEAELADGPGLYECDDITPWIQDAEEEGSLSMHQLKGGDP
jgi:hypothetical protein